MAFHQPIVDAMNPKGRPPFGKEVARDVSEEKTLVVNSTPLIEGVRFAWGKQTSSWIAGSSKALD